MSPHYDYMIHLPSKIQRCDPEPFRENITDDMTDDAFLYQVLPS